ncbi:MAG: hypothetical protein UX21_C0046G0001 [Microgenomates group bacterium GW2011_GWC2_45_8]|nr:MAG: hypothetical protein UX21_C0046G0001 [Microgenomates group bacterium GW2011_GWC2_45_8]
MWCHGRKPVGIHIGPVLLMPFFPRLIKFGDIKREIVLGKWLIPLLGLINIFEYYFMIKAYALADASLVVPVVSLSTVFTVIVGIIFLGERDNFVKKIIAGILAFIGLLLISNITYPVCDIINLCHPERFR